MRHPHFPKVFLDDLHILYYLIDKSLTLLYVFIVSFCFLNEQTKALRMLGDFIFLGTQGEFLSWNTKTHMHCDKIVSPIARSSQSLSLKKILPTIEKLNFQKSSPIFRREKIEILSYFI